MSKHPTNKRELCLGCLKPHRTCYCKHVRPIRPQIRFLILQHPLERKRTVGTARMAHRCIEDSLLIAGRKFEENSTVNAWIADPKNHCVVLYPGPNSSNISKLDSQELHSWYPQGKQLVIFVIDGTWFCAKQMLRQSPNLLRLPQICFSPTRKSEYRFRQQPEAHCLSTIEAIHQVLEILDPQMDANNLLYVFREMVQQQIEITRLNQPNSILN